MVDYVLIDGRNIAYAAQGSKKLTVGGSEVQAIYGFIRTMRMIVERYPNLKPIVLWDGISWRYKAYAPYKAARNKTETKSQLKSIEEKAALNKQIPVIMKALTALGIEQMIADNYEADDLAGMIVRENPESRILLISGDKDWVQLISDRVVWLDPIRDIRITPSNIEEKLDVATAAQWLEFRVLKGDVSDNITGVGGIGDVGAKALLKEYGSVTGFINQYNDGTITDLPKKFESLVLDEDKHDLYRRNMMLMDLNSSSIPKPQNLRTIKGELSKETFKFICERLAFKSIMDYFSDWIRPFERKYE